MKKMQQTISKYYQELDEKNPDIAFEDCFPAADPSPLLWIGRGVAAGLAAVLVIAVAIGYSAWDRHGQLPGDVMVAQLVPQSQLQQALQAELEHSEVLDLSDEQTAILDQLLAGFATADQVDVNSSLAQVKRDWFRAVASNNALALSAGQTRAVAGLMSSWTPQLDNGTIIANTWLDDAGLEQYLAGCSAFCHQNTSATQIQDYLADCVVRGFSFPCNVPSPGMSRSGFETVASEGELLTN